MNTTEKRTEKITKKTSPASRKTQGTKGSTAGKQSRQRRQKIGACGLGLVLAVGLLAWLHHSRTAQVYPGLPDPDPEPAPVETGFYAEECFYTGEDGWLHFEDEEYTSRRGVDVSSYQKKVDWEKVRAAGADFAIIRLGYRGYETGLLNEDPYFAENLEGARAAGLDTGVYFFSQAVDTDEAMVEANFVLEKLKEYGAAKADIPVFFDMEPIEGAHRIEGLTVEEKTAIADAFCRVIRKGGRTAALYGNPDWLEKDVDMRYLTGYPLWLAHYTETAVYPYAYAMWQYSNNGYVDGIGTHVDLDILLVPKDETAPRLWKSK